MKSLLIGNGLNLTNSKNNFLWIEDIYIRFRVNLTNSKKLFEEMFNINMLNIEDIIPSKKFTGIEELSGILFEYIYNEISSKREFNWNDCYRLLELISEISIESIFFENNKFNKPVISEIYINKIKNEYENIFSLNYIENWDKTNKVKYLHGNIKKYCNDCTKICSSILCHNDVYKNYQPLKCKKIDFNDIIFIPTNKILTKYEYIEEGLYPNKCGLQLYPANDLFPYSGRKIYKDLANLDELDVFGVSPYGDEALIKKIKDIKKVRIFVYNNNDAEISKWKEYGVNATFIDSKNFI